MATAWFNALASPGTARAESAGLEPATTLLPWVVSVMREVALDVSLQVPRLVSPDIRTRFALVIVIAPDADGSSAFGEASELDDVWLVDDAAGQSLEHVRRIRGDVEHLVRRLLHEHQWMPPGWSPRPPTL